MVNRPFSYFYNNFLGGIRPFCVNGRQLGASLPEIRAMPLQISTEQLRDSALIELIATRSENIKSLPPPAQNIFSL
jgi:hypothetical protein